MTLLVLLVVAETAVHLHPHFEVDGWFAFAAWYGFGACIVFVAVARALAWVLQRPNGYYSNTDTEPVATAVQRDD
jgi:hypothetical protein